MRRAPDRVQVELKTKYKYRLFLDESFSIGSVGPTGRGLTEHFGVPASSIDMLVGSLAHSLCCAGGFCAGSHIVVNHQVKLVQYPVLYTR